MRLSLIAPNQAHIALVPKRAQEIEAVILPLTYLGNSRWKTRHVASGQVLYVASRKILRLASIAEAAQANAAKIVAASRKAA